MLSGSGEVELEALRLAIRQACRIDETACLRERLQNARLAPEREQAVQDKARTLAAAARKLVAEHAHGVVSDDLAVFTDDFQRKGHGGSIPGTSIEFSPESSPEAAK